MKKFLSVLLTLVLALSLFPAAALGATVASGTCGTNLNWTLDSAGKLTVSGTGAMDDYSLWFGSNVQPWQDYRASIKTVSVGSGVTAIGEGAFGMLENLTSVTIASTVTSVGAEAFRGCASLASVTLPSGLTQISRSTFNGCTSLTSFAIPNNVITVGNSAFDGCTSLTQLQIGSSVETINSDAFAGTGITTVTLPASLTEMQDGAFYRCTSLKEVLVASGNTAFRSVNGILFDYNMTKLICYPANKAGASYTVPVGVTTIARYSFAGNRNLTSLIVSEGLTGIGYGAFSETGKLRTVKLPDSYTRVVGTFFNCTSLTSVTLGQYVTDISRAFEGCSSLTQITLPETLTSIGDDAFKDCTSLANITLHDGIRSLGQRSFQGCVSLTDVKIPYGITAIPWYCFDGCTGLTSISLPNSLKTLAVGALHGCSSLRKLEIPSSVTNVVQWSLNNCSSLKQLYFYNANCSIDKGAFMAEPNADLVIYGYSGSTAQTFANKISSNNVSRPFVAIDNSHSHHYTAGKETVPATCTAGGYVREYCPCGAYLTSQTFSAIGHDWDYGNAVFNWDGYACPNATVTCLTNASHTENVNVTVTSATIEPSCEEDGKTVYTARFSVGADTYTDTKEETLNAAGHVNTENVGETDSTCIAHGYTAGVWCSDCETWISGHEEKPFADHTWDEGEITKPATCVAKGETTYACTVPGCSETKTVEDVAENPDHHTGGTRTENEELVPGTCVAKKTWKEVVYCVSCGETVSSTPKTGEKDPDNHVNTTEAGESDSSCTAHGYTAGVWCGDCETWISGHEEKPLVPHSYVGPEWKWNGTASANAVFACTCCGDTQSVPAEIFSETVKEPTDTEAGKKVYTATVEFEGNTYTDTLEKSIPALNEGLCKWCGERHEGFFGRILGFFHSVAYFFAHLFGRK